jgi:hypothetical protein
LVIDEARLRIIRAGFYSPTGTVMPVLRSKLVTNGAFSAAVSLATLLFGCSPASMSGKPGVSGPSAGAAGTDSVGAAGTGAGPVGTDAGAAGATNSGFGSYGQDTPGGKGGAVIKVTTLAANGPGSLSEALAAPGSRIIVFEVGGVIDLNLGRLRIAEPFVTIAGQSAPSPGISVIRGGFSVLTHDVVIQHIRFRMGDAGALPASGFEPDVTTDGAAAYNIIFDHCSAAWAVDENLSVSGPRFDGPAGTSHRVTIENSIVAEGLNNSVHSKGAHSMGSLIHDYCTDVAVVGNLYAHNNERNPWFKGFASGVIVNNVVYNPGKWAMRLGPVDTEWAGTGITPEGPKVSIVGNYMRHGANTPVTQTLVGSNSRGSAYLDDNIAVNVAGAAVPIASPTVTLLAEKPAWPDGLVARPASDVVDWVVAHAGARPKDRDSVDQRIVADFMAGTGTFVDSQNDVGGYPSPEPTQRSLEVPADVDGWLKGLAAEVE